ncbi:phosphatidylserine/phosphatidylglycerophosphate/cardiolipin synthase-like enzyme [Pseudomonas baetica]|nr:phosphatidylserine/phosphatidylglycerophosphate/cardiolipin synthase-like enzyme [Pseudomonas baetica]
MAGAIFPWREGNHFELLVDGPQFFPRMLVAIARAEEQVELELYLVEAGACAEAMVQALVQAAERGVRVRCLFDDYGSLAFTLTLRQRLMAAGVELRFYNRLNWRRWVGNFYRDHRKLLLVDQSLAVVGGTGVTDEFWTPGEDVSEWHEVMVEITGPLVLDWQLLFDRQWIANRHRRAWRPASHFGLPRLPRVPSMGEGMGRVAYADARHAPGHSAIAGTRLEQRPSTNLAGHAVLFADLESSPFPAPGGCPWRRCAFAADRTSYRSPVRALRRASLLPATAQGRGEDFRVPAVFPAPENGLDR